MNWVKKYQLSKLDVQKNFTKTMVNKYLHIRIGTATLFFAVYFAVILFLQQLVKEDLQSHLNVTGQTFLSITDNVNSSDFYRDPR